MFYNTFGAKSRAGSENDRKSNNYNAAKML